MQMGTTKYETNCRRMRFKNIYLETADQKTILLMSDQVPEVSLGDGDVSDLMTVTILRCLRQKSILVTF